jgi:ubiquinone/menaquinone biosynthesis C-methylase UbiE
MDPRDLWTERLLTDAGIAAGLRVVDLGCGRGDVSLMLARLVGDSGRVLGIDRDPGPLAVARQRASELGVVHVEFVEADLHTVLADRGPFDAVVRREFTTPS